MAVACDCILKNEDQSAEPAVNCAFVLINPIVFAASGSLRMIMNNPPTSGAMENPSAVKNGTVDLRIFKNSIHNAEIKFCMIHR